MKEFSHAFMITICLFMVGPSDLQAQINNQEGLTFMPSGTEATPGDDGIILKKQEVRTYDALYRPEWYVKVDTIHAYPDYAPYYYELIIETPALCLYRICIKQPHGMKKKGWVYGYACGEKMTAAETQRITDAYLPEWKGDYHYLDRNDF